MSTVLTTAQTLCAIAHAVDPDETVQAVCGITEDLLPVLKDVLGQQREAAKKYAAEHVGCAHRDAGP